MNINDYFNEIQEYIKKTVENSTEVNDIVKELNKDNLQAVINQDFNNNISVEECAKKLLNSLKIKVIDENEPNHIDGERALNKMERKLMKYSEFVNENRSQDENEISLIKNILIDFEPFIMREGDKIVIKFDKVSDTKKSELLLKDSGFDCYMGDSTTILVFKIDEMKEHNEWKPTDKYYSHIIYGDDIKDENTIMQFIEYNNINPLVGDIWKYAKGLGRYPSKMSDRAMKYSGHGDSIVEIEFGDKIYLWHFQLHYISSEHRFDNKLIKQCNFTYKDFKEMLGESDKMSKIKVEPIKVKINPNWEKDRYKP